MLQNVTITPARRSLEFGIYRDGDNNLDAIQESTLSQALRASARDSRIEFTVEDTTALRAPFVLPLSLSKGQDDKVGLHTDEYTISDGDVGNVRSYKAADMSDEANLARFVARTLDNAQRSGAKQTWIDLVDHGGGDGGGLETGDGSVMSMPDIAKAVSDGLAMHAAAHPDDARRSIDGVVANQCLMDTMGFAEGYYTDGSNVRSAQDPAARNRGERGWRARFGQVGPEGLTPLACPYQKPTTGASSLDSRKSSCCKCEADCGNLAGLAARSSSSASSDVPNSLPTHFEKSSKSAGSPTPCSATTFGSKRCINC